MFLVFLVFLTRFEKFTTLLLKWIAVTFFIGGALLYGFQILARLMWSGSFFWIDSMISYLLTLAALMGAALAVRNNENIKIDIFREFSKKKIIRLIINLLSIAVTIALILVFYYHSQVLKANKNISIFKVPEWILNIPYLILFTGSLIYYLKQFQNLFSQQKEKEKEIS